jgi:spermidine/putrescine transport system permease protein
MKWTGLPAKIWMCVFVLLPFVWLLFLSLHQSAYHPQDSSLGLNQFRRALNPPFSGIIVFSLFYSFAASLCVLCIAVPIVWFVSQLTPQRRTLWLVICAIPLGLNFVVRIYAWFVLIRPEGLLTRTLATLGVSSPLASSNTGVFLSLVYGYLPLAFLPLYSVFERLDRSQLEAATDLGADAFQRWRLIIFPAIVPGLIASFIFVFVPMLGEYLIPRMIGGGLVATLGTQIESQFLGSTRPNWPFGAALSLCLLACATAILAFAVKLLPRGSAGQKSTWSILQVR